MEKRGDYRFFESDRVEVAEPAVCQDPLPFSMVRLQTLLTDSNQNITTTGPLQVRENAPTQDVLSIQCEQGTLRLVRDNFKRWIVHFDGEETGQSSRLGVISYDGPVPPPPVPVPPLPPVP